MTTGSDCDWYAQLLKVRTSAQSDAGICNDNDVNELRIFMLDSG